MKQLAALAFAVLSNLVPAKTGAEFVAFNAPMLALTHVEVVDGTGGEPMHDMTVLIRNGRIEALDASAKVSIPKGAEVKDLKGKSITPGFVMLHEHMFYPIAYYAYGAMFQSFPHLYLAGGATTIRTAGSMSPYADLNVRKDIDAGENVGPDIDVTAPFLNGPVPFVMQVQRITSAKQASEMVHYWADEGATSYKAYMHLTRDELAAVVAEAHAHQQKVTGHLCSITFREAVDLGIDNLEHGFFPASDFVKDKQPDLCPSGTAVNASLDALPAGSPDMRSLEAYLIQHHVALTSTLTIFETFASGRPAAPSGALDLLAPPLREMYLRRWSSIASDKDNVYSHLLVKDMVWEKQFFDQGGLLVAGTDPTGYGGVVPGFSNVREVELLMEAGLTLPQAIKVSTLNGATYLGRDKDVGSLVPGKRADLVIFDGMVSEDHAALKRILWTVKAGVGYDSAKIRAAYLGKVGYQ